MRLDSSVLNIKLLIVGKLLKKINDHKSLQEFIESLNWSYKELEDAKIMLKKENDLLNIYYKKLSYDSQKFFVAQHEFLKNSIEYWEKKLNETKSP